MIELQTRRVTTLHAEVQETEAAYQLAMANAGVEDLKRERIRALEAKLKEEEAQLGRLKGERARQAPETVRPLPHPTRIAADFKNVCEIGCKIIDNPATKQLDSAWCMQNVEWRIPTRHQRNFRLTNR